MSIEIKIYGKRELANLYGVSYNTFRDWISRSDELKHKLGNHKYKRLFTPKQVEIIIEHLGEP